MNTITISKKEYQDLIVPVGGLLRDEGVRKPNRQKLASLKPLFRGGNEGSITAGNASQLSDGAAALLILTAE